MRERIGVLVSEHIATTPDLYLAGVDQKYGRIFTENPNGITEDEPVFLLVAHDDFSLETLERWEEEADLSDADASHRHLLIESITDVKNAFSRWRAEHSLICHIPD